jgi:hypothetical protein
MDIQLYKGAIAMRAKQSQKTSSGNPRKSLSGKNQTGRRRTRSSSHEPAKLMGRTESGQPGDGAGRVDIVGKVPSDIRVDSELTEGHPGYDETGPSEIIPVERMLDAEPSTREG